VPLKLQKFLLKHQNPYINKYGLNFISYQ